MLGSWGSGALFGKSEEQGIGSTLGGLAGTYFGGPIGSAIGSFLGGAIGSLFGSDTKPGFNLGTTGTLSNKGPEYFENQPQGVYAEGALGTVGFINRGTQRLKSTFGGFDKAKEFLEQIAQMDNLVASLASNEDDLSAMQKAVRGIRLRGGNPKDIANQLSKRTDAALDALSGQFGEFVDSLSGGIEEVVAKAQAGRQAFAILSEASTHLNLSFDDSADGAYQAAASLAEMAGGVQALAATQEGYYQAFYSEAEKERRVRRQITQALSEHNLALPETRQGYRELAEAQNLNTESGREAYATLMSVAGAFAEIVPPGEEAVSVVEQLAQQLDDARDAVASAENQVRRAWQTFDKQSFGQRITLLEMLGDSEQALALQRERELLSIDPLLHETQRRIWALQDEAKAQQEAAQAAQAYQRELSSLRSQLDGILTGIGQWVDTQRATGQSPGNNLTAAGDQFARQLTLAEGGDRDALQSITQYADQYLAAGRDMYASGSGFQRIEQDVLAALESLPEVTSAEEYLAEEIRTALREATSDISTELGGILRGDNPSRIAGALSGHFATLAGGIDGVLTREQLAVVMAGKATDAQIAALMRAVDLNGDGVMTGLESVIIKSMPTDATLANALQNQLEANGNKALTHAQVRDALSPVASKAIINRLINRADRNADGIITAQELANARLDGLASGIGSAVHPMFDSLDSSLDGLIDYAEFASAFEGMATDAQLRELFNMLDANGDGQLSKLEALEQSSEGTEGNTKTMEERARDQLAKLVELSQEMARTTDQFVGLNAGIDSLTSVMALLVDAQEEMARIEREKQAAEIAQLGAVEKARMDSQRDELKSSAAATIERFESRADDLGLKLMGSDGKEASFDVTDSGIEIDYQYIEYSGSRGAANAKKLKDELNDELIADVYGGNRKISELDRILKGLASDDSKLSDLRQQYSDLMGEPAPFALGGMFTNGIVTEPTSFPMGLMGEAGPEAIMPLHRGGDGSLGVRAELPALPPLLGGGDVIEVLQDLKREVAELRRENAKLQGEGNKHAAASVQVQQAGFTRQIEEQRRGNRSLDEMSSNARLEAAR